MVRQNIDFGIDLGTTNSEIAVWDNGQANIIRNMEGFDYTPSAVWIDTNLQLWVGRRAKEHEEDDKENCATEFKLLMGTKNHKLFTRSNKTMTPEELSAEVLKELKRIVHQRLNEEIEAAVITVPAEFDHVKCHATIEAAKLAGLKQTPLLQEPVAAGLAYGFEKLKDNRCWLVYDFGGGTFDAALIRSCSGLIQVINHGGDRHLGGKDIDWEIVNNAFVPALMRDANYRLSDFKRGNNRWIGAFAKLKHKAEEAKIALSATGREYIDVIIDYLCRDDRNNNVIFIYQLKRSTVCELAMPIIRRTIDICRRVIQESGLQPRNIERVILVGGPTMMPCLRTMLKQELGIEIDYSVDPLTVVARGAALFAGTQRLENPCKKIKSGQFIVELNYTPIAPHNNLSVSGKVKTDPPMDFTGFQIKFINDSSNPPWESGMITLRNDGAFFAGSLKAQSGIENIFKIRLYNSSGFPIETNPPDFKYTVGAVVDRQTLIHSIGVATFNNKMRWFFEKGTNLPAKKMVVFETAFPVRRDSEKDVIRIPVMEGVSERADRNFKIGNLEIKASQVEREVPEGTEVQVTIHINEARLITIEAYIPLLDRRFENVLMLGYDPVNPSNLSYEFNKEKERFERICEKVKGLNDGALNQRLQEINKIKIINEINQNLAAAHSDPCAGEAAKYKLIRLKILLDEIEDKIEFPALVKESYGIIEKSKEIIKKVGTNEEVKNLEKIKENIEMAIKTNDLNILQKSLDEIKMYVLKVLVRDPSFHVVLFEDLKNKQSEMSNQKLANEIISRGLKAIKEKRFDELLEINQQLMSLLPHSSLLSSLPSHGSTVRNVNQ